MNLTKEQFEALCELIDLRSKIIASHAVYPPSYHQEQEDKKFIEEITDRLRKILVEEDDDN